MTAVMQSSTAAIAVTLTAYYAGAVALDQGCALVIGQNIGTATSSALAAIGASSTAKRLALAYILFKLVAAVIALLVFPVTIPLLVRASHTIDGVTLLAAYHTAYNVVGVAVLLPLIEPFTRFVERMLPERESPLTRSLDPAALVTPIAAEEAVRRTVARSLGTMCGSINAALTAMKAISVDDASAALRRARDFVSEASGPPESEAEHERLTSTLLALDYAFRLAEAVGGVQGEGDVGSAANRLDDERAAALCAEAMRHAIVIADDVGALPDAPLATHAPATQAIRELEHCANSLHELQGTHRNVTIRSVAGGAMRAEEAFARVDAVRRLETLTRHAWRSAAHLMYQLPQP
jgi:phosphate:Na+ symporter